jgi:23S rRNA (adenine2503-C2)-methyltransferase
VSNEVHGSDQRPQFAGGPKCSICVTFRPLMSLNDISKHLASPQGPVDRVLEAQPGLPEVMPQVAEKVSFFDLPMDELALRLSGMGKEKFRAKQLFNWVYQQRIHDFDQMSNVSKAFRAELPMLFDFHEMKVVQELKSVDGTRKWLFDVGQGMTVETVLIPSKDRLTLCVSSEVGCNMACRFCYTGKQKMKRRLSAGEIVGQFLHASDSLKKDDLRVTNIVFMGMGEPLDNPDEVFKAIRILHEPDGIGFSRRKITVSTSGIVPLMPKITEAGVRMAVSLNAPNDETRTKVMPINKRWNIHQLLDACKAHSEASGDHVTLEYVLLKDVTDRLEHARELYQLTKDVQCKINIIPFNEHPGTDYLRPDAEQVVKFQNELIRLGAHVLLRRTMGRDIFAACGQLTSLYEGRPETMSTARNQNFNQNANQNIVPTTGETARV